MGTLLTLWFIGSGIWYLCTAILHLLCKLPAAAVFLLALPAMPFVVAHRNRTEHPVQAKIIRICWGLLYVGVIGAGFIG